jgi:hypothetical protein
VVKAAKVLTIISIVSNVLFMLVYVKARSENAGSSNRVKWRVMLGLLGLGITSQLAAVLEFSFSLNCVLKLKNFYSDAGYSVTQTVRGSQILCIIAISFRLMLFILTLIQAKMSVSSRSVAVAVPIAQGAPAEPQSTPPGETSTVPPPTHAGDAPIPPPAYGEHD